jgi:hypothetical protein
MRKLKLDLDALDVESFDANPPAAEDRGTVQGAAPPPDNQLPPDDTTGGGGSGNIYCISAYPCVPSNEATCNAATCGHTCWPTCYC